MAYQRKISFKDADGGNKGMLAVWVLAGVILLSIAVFALIMIRKPSEVKNLTAADKKKQGEEVLKKFQTRIQIPKEESPQVALVTDEASLHKKSPLYKDAKNGNYIIVTSKWVAIYDSDNDKVVSMIPTGEK